MIIGRQALRRRPARSSSAPLLKDVGALAADRVVRRRALGLGALASVLAFIGRSAARAADALTIEPNGDVRLAGALRIAGKNALEFGTGIKYKVKEKDNQGKEIEKEVNKQGDAGKIGYQTFTTDALDIVGAGTDSKDRKIKLWTEGGMTIAGPIAAPLQIAGKNALEFGTGIKYKVKEKDNQGKEIEKEVDKQGDAGKIGYQTFTTDALDIVGAGTDGKNRKIKLWAEGGTALSGPLNVAAARDETRNAADVANASRENGAVDNNRPAKHPTGLALYVTANSIVDGSGVEFRHSNGTSGIGFGFNTIYATGDWADQSLYLRARGNGTVQLRGQKMWTERIHVTAAETKAFMDAARCRRGGWPVNGGFRGVCEKSRRRAVRHSI